MNWLRRLMSSPLVWGVGIVAVGYAGYTVYQRVTRREPPPPPAQGPNEEDGEGVEPIVGPPPPSTATAAPEIRRTVSGERVGRRNSQGATPVLSGRGREGSVDPMPDLPPPAVAPPPTPPAIPRVAEEHEHLTAPVPHIEDNTVAAQQMAWSLIVFIMIALLGHTGLVTPMLGTVLSSVGYVAAGALAVVVSPSTFRVPVAASSSGVKLLAGNPLATPARSPPHGAAPSAKKTPSKLVHFDVDDSVPVPYPAPVEDSAPAPPHTPAPLPTAAAPALPVPATPPSDPWSAAIASADSMSEDSRRCDECEGILNTALTLATDARARADTLWRLGRTLFRRANAAKSTLAPAALKESYRAALAHVLSAIAANDSNAQAHKWAAILIAYVASSTKDKIENAYRIRDHAVRSISLDPRDPTSHHILGEWAFNVATISWLNRRLASTLFATPPTATLEEALQHFLDAESIRPGFYLANTVRIVETLVELKRMDDAKVRMAAVLRAPRSEEDPSTLTARITELRAKLSM